VPRTISTSPAARHVIAHRAGNRLGALRDAEQLGVRFVEADVRLFWGRLEVRHLKTVGPLPLLWDRWQLAAPWAPRLQLAELLASTRATTELLLDLKGPRKRLGELVAAALVPYLPDRRFTVCARSPRLLEPFDLLPVRRFHSVGSVRQLQAFFRRFEGSRVDGVSVHARLLDREVVRDLRRVADAIVTWPVNRSDEATRLTGLGVDGLISDSPGVLLSTGDAA